MILKNLKTFQCNVVWQAHCFLYFTSLNGNVSKIKFMNLMADQLKVPELQTRNFKVHELIINNSKAHELKLHTQEVQELCY